MRSMPLPNGWPKNGAEIGVDGGNLAIVGNSVGGNMTGVTTLMAKEKKGPRVKFHIMMWPVTDATFEQDSYAQFGGAALPDRLANEMDVESIYDGPRGAEGKFMLPC